MGSKPRRVVLDTNVFISSIVFGGKPKLIINLLQEKKIVAVTTPILIAELLEILTKKFQFIPPKIALVQELLNENFTIVHPTEVIDVVRDDDDNKVLEAATEGKCHFVVTGDKDLLDIKIFKNIPLLTPEDFLLNI